MNNSKCIVSLKTHCLITDKNGSPSIHNNQLLLYNRPGNCVIEVEASPSMRQIFGVPLELHDSLATEVVSPCPPSYDESQTSPCDESQGGIQDTQDTMSVHDNEKLTSIIELLISEYAKRPPLYDERLPLIQRSKSIKKALEMEVYYVLNEEILLEEIPKKWQYLKKEYRKHKMILNKYVRSGCSFVEAAAIVGKPLWKHYAQMCFIDDRIDERNTESNIPSDCLTSWQAHESRKRVSTSSDLVESGPSSSESIEREPFNTNYTGSKLAGNATPVSSKLRTNSENVNSARLGESTKKRKSDTAAISKIDELIINEINKGQSDSVDHFCRMLAMEMKNLDSRKRMKLQIDMMELLSKAANN